MEKTRMISQKRVHGEVESNDGEFAEIRTVGIEGIEKDLLLDTIQAHREDTENTPEEFQRRFPVGSWLDICTTIEVMTLESLESNADDVDEGDQATGEIQVF
jgi:hypothetical protein